MEGGGTADGHQIKIVRQEMEMELYRDSAQVDSGLVTSIRQFAPARMTGPGTDP